MKFSNDYLEKFLNLKTEKAECFSNEIDAVNADCEKAAELENKGDFEQAIYFYKRTLEIRLKNEELTALADAFERIGVLYTIKNDFAAAAQSFKKAMKYRSLENDLPGFCRVHLNLSRMHFFEALHTNKKELLIKAQLPIDIALSHLSHNCFSELYIDCQMKCLLIKAQSLRFSGIKEDEAYLEILSQLSFFADILKDNFPNEKSCIVAAKNNMAVILALIGKYKKAEKLIAEALNEKAVLYNAIKNPENFSFFLTKNNFQSIILKNPEKLILEY